MKNEAEPEAVTIGTYLGSTKAKIFLVVLLLWAFFFFGSLVAGGCDSSSITASKRVSLCNFGMTLSSLLPGNSHRLGGRYLHRGIAYFDLGDGERAHDDFLSAIYERASWKAPYDIAEEDPPRWLREFSRTIDHAGVSRPGLTETWHLALHEVKCSKPGTIPPECWKTSDPSE